MVFFAGMCSHFCILTFSLNCVVSQALWSGLIPLPNMCTKAINTQAYGGQFWTLLTSVSVACLQILWLYSRLGRTGDFAWETYTSLRFFWHYLRGHPDTRVSKDEISHGQTDFAKAFIEKDRSLQVNHQAIYGFKTNGSDPIPTQNASSYVPIQDRRVASPNTLGSAYNARSSTSPTSTAYAHTPNWQDDRSKLAGRGSGREAEHFGMRDMGKQI